jgi:hypothetical protein
MPALSRARNPRLRRVAVARPSSARALVAGVVAAALALALHAGTARARCFFEHDHSGSGYAPCFVVHFADPSELPLRVACSTTPDPSRPELCIPVYAYDLWDGADAFEFSISTPEPPLGFDPGPGIELSKIKIDMAPDVAVTSLQLGSHDTVCGPIFLGCLRLPTPKLPASFAIGLGPDVSTGRCAAHAKDGGWRASTIDPAAAHVGAGLECPPEACTTNTPITGLVSYQGEGAGLIHFEWTSGSGSYTMLRFRTDGRYPADPWDGELLALLPSDVTRFTHGSHVPGEMRVSAWSVSYGPQGNLRAASGIDCGALTSIVVQLPVGTASSSWSGMKTLYR